MNSNDAYVSFQLSVSTAEDEVNYFTGIADEPSAQPGVQAELPAGFYRVVNGELCRVLQGSSFLPEPLTRR